LRVECLVLSVKGRKLYSTLNFRLSTLNLPYQV
jgi:hypothetical protein